MKKLIFMAVLVLAGCAGEGDEAAEAYEQERISGASMTQLCRSAKATEQAYRSSKDNAKAEQWALYARVDCNSASLMEDYRPY